MKARSGGIGLTAALLVGAATGTATGVVGLTVGRSLPGLLALVSGITAAITVFLAIRFLIGRRVREAFRLTAQIKRFASGQDHAPIASSNDLDDLKKEIEGVSASVAARIARLERIENYRQEFLGDVSHELQTPIFAVQGFAETLLEGALEDPSVNRLFVERIHKNAFRLSTLVNDLSDISQIETGSLRMNRLAFDPRALTHETVEALQMSADQSGIQMHVFVAQDVGLVVGDRARVRQVLSNLLTNGIKYNGSGGSVELAVWKSSDEDITFSVSDDGIGIAPAEVARVTERFYRVDKSRSRDGGGTGLGLAIVKHIVEAHGSTLQIRSKPGQGSTFDFALPAAQRPNPPQSEPSRTP